MTDKNPAHEPHWFSLPVWERVLLRVHMAQLAPDDRISSSSPRKRERRAGPEGKREAQALRRVFLELRDSYREYRRRTGVPVASEVREAAYAFKRVRSIESLISVAASLERQPSLRW